MAGRVYTMAFKQVAVTAVQDLLALYTGANSIPIEIHEVTIDQVTASTVGNLAISLKRLPATVTSGSVGAAGVINTTRVGDAAATVTGRVNDTTQATTSGTAVNLAATAFNVINGFFWRPQVEDRPVIKSSQAFIVSLDTAPGSSETMSGTIVFAELV